MCLLSIAALKIWVLFHKLASHNETLSIVDNKELTVSCLVQVNQWLTWLETAEEEESEEEDY